MKRMLVVAALLALPGVARAQGALATSAAPSYSQGINPLSQDLNGNLRTTTPSAPTNSASFALSTSAALNTAQLATGSAFPATWGTFYADNPAATDIAVCKQGGTCTCPASSIAATNGVTVPAGVSRFPFNGNGAAAATPTWVSCSGSAVNVGVEW